MPLEYCEYSGITEKCLKWAEENAPEIIADLTISAGEGEEKKHQKRGGKGPKVRDLIIFLKQVLDCRKKETRKRKSYFAT